MLKYKPSWVEPEIRKGDKAFDLYPEESIADWHKRAGTVGGLRARLRARERNFRPRCALRPGP